jgi:REP element-mobilizing transposase RayT
MKKPARRHPPHFPPIECHNTPIIIFLTVCTKNRKQLLASEVSHCLLGAAWAKQPTWLVGRYTIMPDHIHLFCAPADLIPMPLESWVRFWKFYVTKHWHDPSQLPIWQRHFWDTQLRKSESYEEKWDYVFENPVRAHLVKKSEDWPYQGELNLLDW